MSEFIPLQNHLRSAMPNLSGPWVMAKSGYERRLAECLEMELSRSRYWDARWNHFLLEFKKGKSIWVDLVRYSETLVRLNEAALAKTQTLFFLPDQRRERIEEIVCVESARLIEFLGLSDETVARSLLSIKARVPHSLNAQARLTWRDVRSLQQFAVRTQLGGNRECIEVEML